MSIETQGEGEAQPTPGPYRVSAHAFALNDGREQIEWLIFVGGVETYVHTLARFRHESDAEHFVRCANAHEQLVAALKEFDAAFAEFDTYSRTSRHRMRMAVIAARAVLALIAANADGVLGALAAAGERE